MDALCGEQNPVDNKQVNRDDDRAILANGPLYNGAPITVGVSIFLIITSAVRHSLTGVANSCQFALCPAKSVCLFDGTCKQVFYETKESYPVSLLLYFLYGVSRPVY